MVRRSQNGNWQAGFTVAELLVVLLIIGLISAVAVPNINGAITRARESTLREDLSVMRRALDDYYADKGEYPAALDDLVGQKYIRFIPKDPVSSDGAGWEAVTAQSGGIIDINSTSEEIGTNETPYSEW